MTGKNTMENSKKANGMQKYRSDGEDEKCIQILVCTPERKRPIERVILKWILKKYEPSVV
jgi:hypothetical protein